MRTLLLVMLAAATADAAPVKPPIGWTTDPAAAVSMSKQLGEVPHFGGLSSFPTTEVYRAPGGGSLFVTRVLGTPKPEERDRAVTVELFDLDAAMKRAGANAKSEVNEKGTVPALRLLEGRLTWRDVTTGVTTISRMVVAADAKQIIAVTGECVLAGDTPPDVVKVCTAALASLDTEIPVEKRVVLNLTANAIPPAAPSKAEPTMPAGPSMLEGGERPALPPMTIPQTPVDREPDRRPVYVGLGLVVLAVLFWWNRKNREKLERAYETRIGDRESAKPDRPRDGDADDLHAAAADEGKSSGTKEV